MIAVPTPARPDPNSHSNDITDTLQQCNVRQYADGTVLYLSLIDDSAALTDMKTDTNSLVSWCRTNKMHVNTTKTKIVVYGSRKSAARFREILKENPISMANSTLAVESNYKYLGINLDYQLNLNDHAKSVANVANGRIRLLTKIRKNLTFRASLLIYKATILPQIEYGNFVYFVAKKSILKSIQISQYRALKCCLHLPLLTDTEEVHIVARLRPLSERYLIGLGRLAYEYSKDSSRHHHIPRLTRSQFAISLKIPNYKKSSSRNSVSFRCCHFWNQLAPEIRRLESYVQYLKAITKTIHKYYPP